MSETSGSRFSVGAPPAAGVLGPWRSLRPVYDAGELVAFLGARFEWADSGPDRFDGPGGAQANRGEAWRHQGAAQDQDAESRPRTAPAAHGRARNAHYAAMHAHAAAAESRERSLASATAISAEALRLSDRARAASLDAGCGTRRRATRREPWFLYPLRREDPAASGPATEGMTPDERAAAWFVPAVNEREALEKFPEVLAARRGGFPTRAEAEAAAAAPPDGETTPGPHAP
jgi:hypothetical protein